MAIDPRISLAYVPPQIDWSRVDPFARQQKQLTLQGLMDQQVLRQLQMQQERMQLEQARRQQEAQERLNQFLMGGGAGSGNAPVQQVPPEAQRPIPAEAYLYEEPNLMRPAGPEGRGPGTPFAPAGTQFVQVGAPSTGSPLAGIDPNAMLRVVGAAGLPLAKTLTEWQDAALKRQKTQQEVEIGTAGMLARKLNGVVNESTFKEILPQLTPYGVNADAIRHYMGLGYDDPRTRDWIKSLKGPSVDYSQSVDLQDKLRDQERMEFARRVGQATDLNQIPDILASSSPYIQQFNAGILKAKSLADAQQYAAFGTVKPEVGTTIPYPASVQQQKIDIATSQQLGAAKLKQDLELKEIESLVQAIQRDPTGKLFADLSPENRVRAERILADRGYTTFPTKATDTERRNLNFYERAQQSQDFILAVPQATKENPNPKSLEQIITEKDIWGQLRFQIGTYLNPAQTPEGRRYWQALKQFTEARLRKESGASIQPHEYAESQATYFPIPGDDPDTLEQKRQARQGLLESMKTEAGPAYTQKYGPSGTQTPSQKPKYQTIERTGETPGGRPTITITPGESKVNMGTITVIDPNGKAHYFPTLKQAEDFKKEAGIK